jgi:ribose transport system ATP-binding protein
VRPADPEHSFAELSGGNQQKVVLAKWFSTDPSVLLLHEPTQGVDVGARKDVFRHIRSFTERGGAVIIASTEYEDLAHLCDRVIVFRDGRPVAELQGQQLTPEALVEQAFLVTSIERKTA